MLVQRMNLNSCRKEKTKLTNGEMRMRKKYDPRKKKKKRVIRLAGGKFQNRCLRSLRILLCIYFSSLSTVAFQSIYNIYIRRMDEYMIIYTYT